MAPTGVGFTTQALAFRMPGFYGDRSRSTDATPIVLNAYYSAAGTVPFISLLPTPYQPNVGFFAHYPLNTCLMNSQGDLLVEMAVREEEPANNSQWTSRLLLYRPPISEENKKMPRLAEIILPEGVTAKQMNKEGVLLGQYDTTHPVVLLPVEFKKLWETKNKANQIVVRARRDDPIPSQQTPDKDDNIYGSPRQFLYVAADPADSKYHVSVNIAAGMRDQFVCAAYKSGSKVNGSDKAFPAADDQPADMLIPAAGTDQAGEDFVIKLAFDANKNGTIDVGETPIDLEALRSESGTPLPPMVRGFSPAAVAAADSTIHGQAFGTGWTGWKPNWVGDWFVPNAIALERLFYSGDAASLDVPYRPTGSLPGATLNAFGTPGDFNEWLTHHVGAPFNPDGVAPIPHYQWVPESRIASLIAASSPLSTLKARASIVSQMQSETNATVEAYKQASVGTGQSQILPADPNGHDLQAVLATLGKPHWSPTWVPKQTLLIGDEDGYQGLIPDDAFGTVGRSRFLNGKYWFVVKKENRMKHYSTGDPGGYDIPYTAVVVYLRISGASQDLYDFNHNGGGLSVPAAITQLGYGNGSYGRTHGIIYRTSVNIFKEYEMKEVSLP